MNKKGPLLKIMHANIYRDIQPRYGSMARSVIFDHLLRVLRCLQDKEAGEELSFYFSLFHCILVPHQWAGSPFPHVLGTAEKILQFLFAMVVLASHTLGGHQNIYSDFFLR